MQTFAKTAYLNIHEYASFPNPRILIPTKIHESTEGFFSMVVLGSPMLRADKLDQYLPFTGHLTNRYKPIYRL